MTKQGCRRCPTLNGPGGHTSTLHKLVQACAPSHGHTPSLGQQFVFCFRTCLIKADSIYSASVTNAASFAENTASLRTLKSKSVCHTLHRRQQGWIMTSRL
jgi:hypothetical protein